MKYLNKFVSALFVATLGIMTLASCEGADLYKINAPDWLSENKKLFLDASYVECYFATYLIIPPRKKWFFKPSYP